MFSTFFFIMYFYFLNVTLSLSKQKTVFLLILGTLGTVFCDLSPFWMGGLVYSVFIISIYLYFNHLPVQSLVKYLLFYLIPMLLMIFIQIVESELGFLVGFNLLIGLCFMDRVIIGKLSSLFYRIIFIVTLSFITFVEIVYLNPSISFFLSTLIFLIADRNQSYLKQSSLENILSYQNKIMEQHVLEVEQHYETMRGWRHDYHNHMQTLKAHLEMKRYDVMGRYLNQLEQDLTRVQTIVESNNTNLDAILNSKCTLAKNKEIDITIQAKVPSQLTVEDVDLCVIIGNLLDNAIESCQKIPDPSKRFMRVYIGTFKKQLYLSVTNATNESVRKSNRYWNTQKDGDHGHGLKRIDKVVELYDGFINRKNEPEVFVTEIMLPL